MTTLNRGGALPPPVVALMLAATSIAVLAQVSCQSEPQPLTPLALPTFERGEVGGPDAYHAPPTATPTLGLGMHSGLRAVTPTPFNTNPFGWYDGPWTTCRDAFPLYDLETRRAIYYELVLAQDKAIVEAEAARRKQGISWQQEARLGRDLYERYERDVRLKYLISPDEQLCIEMEGVLHDW